MADQPAGSRARRGAPAAGGAGGAGAAAAAGGGGGDRRAESEVPDVPEPSGGEGDAPPDDGDAADGLSSGGEWEPVLRYAYGVPLEYAEQQPGTSGVPWRQEHLDGSVPMLHAPSMATDDLRGQVARRLAGLDASGAPAYPKEMQQLKLVHTVSVLARSALACLEDVYGILPRQLAVSDAGVYTGGYVDDPSALVATLDEDDVPAPAHRTGSYDYETLHAETVRTLDTIPTLRRLVDLIGTLETTFLQRYAPGQDLAKWNKKQDALLRRDGAAAAAPASAAEAFVSGIDDAEVQRELHFTRISSAARSAPADSPATQSAVAAAAGRGGGRPFRGGGRGRGGRGGRGAAAAT